MLSDNCRDVHNQIITRLYLASRNYYQYAIDKQSVIICW